MAVKFLEGKLGADFMAMYALVLAGLPTTKTLTVRLATWSKALPCAVKICALAESKSLRSMPGHEDGRRPEGLRQYP